MHLSFSGILWLSIFSPSSTSTPIEPGLYRHLDSTLEIIRLETAGVHNVTCLWEGKLVRAKVYHIEGTHDIKKIDVTLPRWARKQFVAVDNMTIKEAPHNASGGGGGKSPQLWHRALPSALSQIIWEVGVIVDLQNTAKVSRNDKHIKSAFAGVAPVHYWSALRRAGDCPTSNVKARADPWHSVEGIISSCLAHMFVWIEANRRYKADTAGSKYLLVFEDDAVCAVRDCAAATDRALAQAGGKVWARQDATPRTQPSPHLLPPPDTRT